MKAFSNNSPLVLVGCGNMGRAMAAGWLKAGLDPQAFWVVDPVATSGAIEKASPDHFIASADDMPQTCTARAIVLAVKPQIMEAVLDSLGPVVGEDTAVISVAAGTPMSLITDKLGEGTHIIRTMPNTPAAVGAGITGLIANNVASAEDRQLAEELLSSVGRTVWIDKEDLMNSVTAVSGSGPAYVFHMVEALAGAAETVGLDAETAEALARQTIIGAAKLLEAEAETDAATLRKNVTSPGGTTAAALSVLMDQGGLASLMKKAVVTARDRGRELAK